MDATLDSYLSTQLHRRVSREELALSLGISVATLGRRKADRFTADDVIAAAHRFGLGYIDDGDLGDLKLGTHALLEAVTDLELAEELVRRVRDGEDHHHLTDPLGEDTEVTDLDFDVSDAGGTLRLADAADDTPDWAREDEERDND
jgi:hypothetical protein